MELNVPCRPFCHQYKEKQKNIIKFLIKYIWQLIARFSGKSDCQIRSKLMILIL